MSFRTTCLQKPNIICILCRVAVLCLCFIYPCFNAVAQQHADTGKITIRILNTRTITYNKTDSGEYDRFVDSVAFLEGTDTLYCDSAYQNSTTRNFEAFGDVKISQQDGTHGTSNYLRYTAAKKMAFMSGDVTLTDGKNDLKCEELNYDMGTKTGEYFKGGTLHSDSTTVTSNTGVYNIHSKDARFKGKVVVSDPKYNIKSEDLGYNTDTKVETFYARSTVTSDSGKSVLVTSSGTYDSKNVIARFTGHSSIWNDGQYMEADTMHYNKVTGYGYAIGNVISIDTGHHSTLYCGHAEFFRRQRILWAMIKPVMEQVNGKDTIYMRSDTFYSAPMVKMKIKAPVVRDTLKTAASDSTRNSDSLKTLKPAEVATDKKIDTLIKEPDRVAGRKKIKTTRPEYEWVVPSYKYRIPDFMTDSSKLKPVMQYQSEAPTIMGKGKRPKMKTPRLKAVDTSGADTTAPMYFVGYNHTLIFSDSLQGKCDSVCYTRSDSTIRMINIPIVWAHNSQITGDTILLYLDSNHLRKMFVPNNSFLVSQTGPAKAGLFNQIQGKTLTGYFSNNAITKMVVVPNAECIYYSQDDKNGAYLGVEEANSTRMVILFNDQKIKAINFYQDTHETMTPLEKADLSTMRLSRFKWLIDQRPKTKEELFK